ncbi:phosphoribosylglycinamide formyltransferase [Candidatus Nitrosotenuis uzonensis]|nr:phosphoribosylglycinamide formyltransferase [Candidatus Nitrosotenuis uzonensis]
MMNLGILISGRGSNMEAILKAVKKQKIPIKPAVVISNNPNAVGLEIAQKLGVSTETVESRGFSGTRWEYDQRIIKILYKYGVTEKDGLVCLAGFMRIISPEFIRKYKNRILNIHPAILPSFPGLHSQRQAVEYGVKYSGCTVHFVDEGVDTGPIILQSIVPVRDNDTEETLSRRILAKEHKIYPQAIKLVAEGKVKIVGRRTVITNQDR